MGGLRDTSVRERTVEVAAGEPHRIIDLTGPTPRVVTAGAGGRWPSYPLWLLAAATLTLLDAAATVVSLQRGAVEANPLLARLIESAGVEAAMGVRVLVGLALLAALHALRHVPLAPAGIRLTVVALGTVAVWHGFLLAATPGI